MPKVRHNYNNSANHTASLNKALQAVGPFQWGERCNIIYLGLFILVFILSIIAF